MTSIIVVILVIIFGLALSWAFTIGIIKLITVCFGLTFNLLIATGIWLILMLVSAFFKEVSNQK